MPPLPGPSDGVVELSLFQPPHAATLDQDKYLGAENRSVGAVVAGLAASPDLRW